MILHWTLVLRKDFLYLENYNTDNHHLANQQKADIRVFTAKAYTLTLNFFIWTFEVFDALVGASVKTDVVAVRIKTNIFI